MCSMADLSVISEPKLKRYAQLIDRAGQLKMAETAKVNFLDFVSVIWPQFICGEHHKKVAEAYERVARGELKRLIVNMPPRHTKSEFASWLLGAWMMGLRPDMKIMETTHTGELALNFGRKVRNTIASQEYGKVFPDVHLSVDSTAAGRWNTNKGGSYFAAGVGGAVTGRGADLLVIDDPHSEQDALSPAALEHAYEWYTSGPRQRLQPGGAIVIVMTRWAENDLTGKVLRQMARDPNADKWEVIELPALLDEDDEEKCRPIWPEYWALEDLKAVKGSLQVSKWMAQWQQNPTSDSAAILKRDWWRKWDKKDLPQMDFVMQSYDTAYSKQEQADYSAITTWGVFMHEDESDGKIKPNVILCDARRGRWDFPILKKIAHEEYEYWDPEVMLIEAKASGMPLAQELRASGIPVTTYAPSRGNDKFVRANSVAPFFEAGLVWAPDTSFADAVIEECAAFPAGENDDYVDTVTMALRRFREGGFISHPTDWEDEEKNKAVKQFY
jgi:predicted phage terminase large subunit-like protein